MPTRLLLTRPGLQPGITRTDVAVFVSPEFSIDYYRDFIRRSTPRLVVVLIHEPDMELR